MNKKRKIWKTLGKVLLITTAVFVTGGACLAGKLYFEMKKTLKNGGYIEDWSSEDGTLLADLPYADGSPSYLYDLYLPANLDQDQPQALMLFIHGGSWTGGTRKDMDYAAKRYAKAGYVTASMEYSLFNSDYTGTTIPAIMDEITACLRAIQEKGKELGLNLNQAALSGASAGGHLALLYSFQRPQESPLPLRFVFEQTGPVDFHPDTWNTGPEGTAGLVSAFTGTLITPEQVENGEAEDLINSVSPAAWVDENTIPALVGYGGKDSIVGTLQPQVLVPRLEEYQVPYTYIQYPNSDHPLTGDPESIKAWHEAVLDYARQNFGY